MFLKLSNATEHVSSQTLEEILKVNRISQVVAFLNRNNFQCLRTFLVWSGAEVMKRFVDLEKSCNILFSYKNSLRYSWERTLWSSRREEYYGQTENGQRPSQQQTICSSPDFGIRKSIFQGSSVQGQGTDRWPNRSLNGLLDSAQSRFARFFHLLSLIWSVDKNKILRVFS